MRTDYKDFIASTENRHYRQVNNDDGTISLVDETVYTQEGDKVSAGVLNELSQNAIWPLQYTKSGTTHQLTGLTAVSGVVSCVFTATADFTAGDTITVDGTAYEIQLSSGDTASDNLFVSGATVSVILDTVGKKVNFKSAGGVKLPAGTWVIVKAYVTSQTVTEDFIVPMDGTYRATVIGAGGKGGNAGEKADEKYSGGGGGSGGWASSVLKLTKGTTIPITCTSATCSFGSYLSATKGKNSFGSGVGSGGKSSGGNVHNFEGLDGGEGERSKASDPYLKGAKGAAMNSPSLSTFITAEFAPSGGSNGVGTTVYDSEILFQAFGPGGGGGNVGSYRDFYHGGFGCPGAVIIELLLKGVNDT